MVARAAWTYNIIVIFCSFFEIREKNGRKRFVSFLGITLEFRFLIFLVEQFGGKPKREMAMEDCRKTMWREMKKTFQIQ